MAELGTALIVGGTSVFGKRLAEHYLETGRSVVVTSREHDRAQGVAAELGGNSQGIALDLTKPYDIADALADVDDVDRLVILSILRDENTVKNYNIDGATYLVTMKLIGYIEVIHALAARMREDSSIVLYGGLAKERPYPGSLTVTSVNGAVMTMIRSLAIELAPIRVNAIHPSIIGDSPYWANKPQEVLDRQIARTPLGRLVMVDEVVDATIFLLENRAVTGTNLHVDGGSLLT